jgi:hypothetical protein
MLGSRVSLAAVAGLVAMSLMPEMAPVKHRQGVA